MFSATKSIEVRPWHEGLRPDEGNEPAGSDADTVRHSCLDLNCDRRAGVAPVEYQVYVLIVYQGCRDIQLPAVVRMHVAATRYSVALPIRAAEGLLDR